MPARQTPPPLARAALVSLLVALALTLSARDSIAKEPTLRHIFVITRVEVPKNASPELESSLRKQLLESIEAQPGLLSAIPEDAPAIDESQKGLAGNKAFRNYMKKKGLRAYKVIVQVTSYEQTSTANPKKSGNIIGSHIALRMFGETLPEHVMAFSGDGSAKVMIEVGKKVRPADKIYADREASALAIADALKVSLKKLEEPPAKPPKQKRKKKKKSSS